MCHLANDLINTLYGCKSGAGVAEGGIKNYILQNTITRVKFKLLFSYFTLGLGGLGPEYLLHAAGPGSTIASSEFPFSIDGEYNFKHDFLLHL
jgi:hypothetical protein